MIKNNEYYKQGGNRSKDQPSCGRIGALTNLRIHIIIFGSILSAIIFYVINNGSDIIPAALTEIKFSPDVSRLMASGLWMIQHRNKGKSTFFPS
jgi:hypothetical protein